MKIEARGQNNELPDKIMINVHPQRWNDAYIPWLSELIKQSVAQSAKLKGMGPKEFFQSFFIDPTPLGRIAQPLDVARAVVFLTSDEAEFIAGSTLNVSGGREMHLRRSEKHKERVYYSYLFKLSQALCAISFGVILAQSFGLINSTERGPS